MNSIEITLNTETTPALILGKKFELSIHEFRTLTTAINALATNLEQRLVAVGHGDFVTEGVNAEFVSGAIGLLVSVGDANQPRPIAYDEIVAASEKARSLPWNDIARLFPEPDRLEESEVGLFALAAGPLAGVKVAFGVLTPEEGDDEVDVDSEDEECGPAGHRWLPDELMCECGEEERPCKAAETTPGLETIRGQDMNQDPNYEGVYGVKVASTMYEGYPVQVDVSPEAHVARLERLGKLADTAKYYLIGRYD